MKGQTPKFVVVLVALAVLLLGVLGVSALLKPQARGELAFDVENVDAGNVPLGKQVVQRFVMRNIGDGPVTITNKNVSALEGC